MTSLEMSSPPEVPRTKTVRLSAARRVLPQRFRNTSVPIRRFNHVDLTPIRSWTPLRRRRSFDVCHGQSPQSSIRALGRALVPGHRMVSEWGCYQALGTPGDGSPSAMTPGALSHMDDLPYSSSELRGLLPIRYVQSLSISMPPRPASARRASGCAASTTAPTPACAPPPPPLSYDRSASPSSAPISATPSAV